jgi:hypothetical protein
MAEYPGDANRRRCERFPLYCPVEFKTKDASPKEASVTLNISENGALILARRAMALYSNIILKFNMGGELLFLIGEVRHTCLGRDGGAYEIGVEFWDKPRAFKDKFNAELTGIMDYQKRYKEEQGGEISLAEASLNWYKETA